MHRSDVFRPENTPLNGILAVELEHGNRTSIFDLTCLNMLLSRQYYKNPEPSSSIYRFMNLPYPETRPRHRLTLDSGYDNAFNILVYVCMYVLVFL